MKVGLFGGSFNPVHNLHLAIAKQVQSSLDLDEVWFMPVFQPVHKHESGLLPFETRVEMLRCAMDGRQGWRAVELERELGGPSFTIRVIRHVKREYPGHSFFFIIGGDSLQDLPGWNSASELTQEIPFAVVARPGFPCEGSLPNKESRWVSFPADPTSSSHIRKCLVQGRLRRLPVPSKVMALIISQNLFHCLDARWQSLFKRIRAEFAAAPAGLREHIEQVACLSAQFAAEFGEDARSGYLAGLAHDMYRGANPEDILRLAHQGRFRLLKKERELPMLAHGAAAAAFLRTSADWVSPSVARAVRWHTFPRLQAGGLAKALVMADALDPSRNNPVLDKLRDAPLTNDWKFLEVVAAKRLRARAKRMAPLRPKAFEDESEQTSQSRGGG